jgi:predicted RNA-binding Zn-ribbon protein involved in translation (DUF1610 family)
MSNTGITYCQSCGAPLNPEMNCTTIDCPYCGASNALKTTSMKSSISIGDGVNISADVGMDNLIRSAQYAISIGQYDKANEIILASIMTGVHDYRLYITKAMADLKTDDNQSLFDCLERLREMELQSGSAQITAAIDALMQYRGVNGVTPLHNATFHERMDLVQFCVEHHSDVNLVAGMNCVTPISIMFVPISRKLSKIDGTPFVHNKQAVKQIRKYLMQYGAKDSWRPGY